MTPSSTEREPGEVGLHVRAAPLDVVAVELERALGRPVLGVEALGVLEPLLVQALEPGVDVVVVRAAPARPEAHRQEQLVDPVVDVLADEVLDELAVDEELVARVLVLERPAHLAVAKSMTIRSSPTSSEDRLVDAGADHVGLLEQRLPPRLELGQQVDPRRRCQRGPLGGDDRRACAPGTPRGRRACRRRSWPGRPGGVTSNRPVATSATRARQHQAAAVAAVLGDVVEEHRLVGEVFHSSPWRSLCSNRSSSRKHGGPADGTTNAGSRTSM